MWSAVLCQTNGLGSLLWLLMKAEIAFFSSLVERCTPRRSCFSVSAANHRSTRLSQLADVGVKCRWYRGLWSLGQPVANQCRFVRSVVVQNQMHI